MWRMNVCVIIDSIPLHLGNSKAADEKIFTLAKYRGINSTPIAIFAFGTYIQICCGDMLSMFQVETRTQWGDLNWQFINYFTNYISLISAVYCEVLLRKIQIVIRILERCRFGSDEIIENMLTDKPFADVSGVGNNFQSHIGVMFCVFYIWSLFKRRV